MEDTFRVPACARRYHGLRTVDCEGRSLDSDEFVGTSDLRVIFE